MVFVLCPVFIQKKYLYSGVVILLLFISFNSLYGNKNFKFVIESKNPNSDYQIVSTKYISLLSTITNIEYLKPVFLIDKKVYTQDFQPIPLEQHCYDQLITITGCDNMDFLQKILVNIPLNKGIYRINIIDNRRCKIFFKNQDNRFIVDFPCGRPNIKKFIFIDKKYKLTDRFKYIDLRYEHFIVALPK